MTITFLLDRFKRIFMAKMPFDHCLFKFDIFKKSGALNQFVLKMWKLIYNAIE